MRFTWTIHEPPQAAGLELRLFADGSSGYLWAKGYFFDDDGRMYYGSEIADWLLRALPGCSLSALLPRMNGCFSVMVANLQKRVVELGADRLATVPVFFHATDQALVVSDEYWSLVQALENPRYDPLGVTGMLFMSHTLGPRTMIEGIQTFAPASVMRFTFQERICRAQQTYWSNAYRPRRVTDYAQLRQDTAEMLVNVFERYTRAVLERGWEVSVALSGGLDSRLAAALMHSQGAPLNIFSYGPRDSAEMITARQVASALSLPFTATTIEGPAVMSPQFIKTQTRTLGMLSRFTTGFGARAALSGCDPNTVFITGHPANLPTGHATPRGVHLLRTTYQNARMIISDFGLPVSDSVLRRLLPGSYSIDQKFQCLADGPLFNPADPLASYEHWTYYFHCTSLLLLEMRTYEDFGHWLLPYMDYELIDYYNTVPLRYRFLRRLHIDTVIQHIFTGRLEPMRDILISSKTPLRLPGWKLRDLLWISTPPSAIGDALLRRQNFIQHRTRDRQFGNFVSTAWGPDPIDYWWHNHPGFRTEILNKLRRWNGLDGLVDVDAVQQVLQEPMHPNFIRFGVATLLTLQAFQELVETIRADDPPHRDGKNVRC